MSALDHSAPSRSWTQLREGNARFASGEVRHRHQDPERRITVASSQTPFAVVLGCIDSRVPVEIVFDQGLGDLAVVRSAGQALDNAVLGSVEYAVAVLHSSLVVVLGHESCGAVKATLEAHRSGTMPGGFIRDIVAHIGASMVGAVAPGEPADSLTADALGAEHVRRTVQLLVERSPVVRAAVDSGECAVVGLIYSLVDGQVRLIEAVGDIDEGQPAAAVTYRI